MTAKILKVAWLAVLLGVGMELLLLLAASTMGTLPGLKPIIADLVQKVSWSLVVCAGLACGTAAAKAPEAGMGAAGFIAAPVGFQAARALHKSTLEALALAGPAAAGVPAPLTLALIKAVEYGCLGVALAVIGKRATTAKSYALTGLATGLVFGGLIIGLTVALSAKTPAAPTLMAKAINEIVFPVGCSLVLFATTAIGKSKT